ncbi:uncharacterized protein LOC141632699 [Silene latifolia]|uniref:uncharacterized protein LOC141632699 n=1 Tax=Silene latifolia TaxID=37657 RepID=UPI003D786414
MTLYDGTTDQLDQVNHYKQKIMVITTTGPLKEACLCKGFGSDLFGVALQWFIGLPNKSIANFFDLVNAFNQQFASSRKPKKQANDLYRIVQGFEESTRDYLKRFNKEKVAVPRCNIATAIQAFRRGLHQDSDLYKNLTMHPCTTFEEVQSKAIAVTKLEEDSAPIRGTYDSDLVSRKAPVEKRSERSKLYSRSVNKVSVSSEGKGEADLLPKPPTEGYSGSRNDTSKKCEFHGSNTHDTDECHSLRKEVKYHYEKGNLDRLLARGTIRVNSADQVLPSPPSQCTRTVNVITGGLELCGLTYSAAKRRATKAKGDKLEYSCRINRQNLPSVTFDETDAQSTPEQHHNALIITLPIGNCEVRDPGGYRKLHQLNHAGDAQRNGIQRKRSSKEGGPLGWIQWRSKVFPRRDRHPNLCRRSQQAGKVSGY